MLQIVLNYSRSKLYSFIADLIDFLLMPCYDCFCYKRESYVEIPKYNCSKECGLIKL